MRNLYFRYAYNVDKEMVQLKFVSAEEKPLGVINWYAIHGTSMNSSNCLVTSDNVGYASILFEKDMNDGMSPGKASKVWIRICFLIAVDVCMGNKTVCNRA